MREDYGNISLVTNDDGFGDMGFDADAPDLMRHAPGLEPSIEQVSFHSYYCYDKFVDCEFLNKSNKFFI